MFADDVSSVADNVRNVQQQIHCIAKYCLENGLGLNIDKSKIMVFRNEGPVKTFEIWIFNTPLEAFKLFDIFVLPILCYSSEIWGYDYSESIEKVHADLCKRVCCLHQNVCNFLPISECVRTPISIVYMSGCVKYWAMLTQMQTHRYPKQCYNVLRNLDNVGRVM